MRNMIAVLGKDRLIKNVAGHVKTIPYRKESFKEIISEYQEDTEGKQVSLEEVFLYYCELDD